MLSLFDVAFGRSPLDFWCLSTNHFMLKITSFSPIKPTILQGLPGVNSRFHLGPNASEATFRVLRFQVQVPLLYAIRVLAW